MATTVPTPESMIARRVARGASEDASRLLLHDLVAAHSGDNLVSALVYQGFATEKQAYAFITTLPVVKDPMILLLEEDWADEFVPDLPAPDVRLRKRCECGAELVWWRGDNDKSCGRCGAWYNAFGQRLRDDWAGNPSLHDDEISDMDGYELQHADDL